MKNLNSYVFKIIVIILCASTLYYCSSSSQTSSESILINSITPVDYRHIDVVLEIAEAVENDWFRIDPKDYERFDMKEPVLSTPEMAPEEVMKICDEIYKVFLSPKYMLKQLVRIRSLRDVKYSVKGTAKVLGHLKDFAKNK